MNGRFTAQLAPDAASLTTIFVTPEGGSFSLQSIVVCNRAASPTTFRVSVAIGGEADAAKQYLYYDPTLAANATFVGDFNVGLNPTDVVRVYSANASTSFTISGQA